MNNETFANIVRAIVVIVCTSYGITILKNIFKFDILNLNTNSTFGGLLFLFMLPVAFCIGFVGVGILPFWLIYRAWESWSLRRREAHRNLEQQNLRQFHERRLQDRERQITEKLGIAKKAANNFIESEIAKGHIVLKRQSWDTPRMVSLEEGGFGDGFTIERTILFGKNPTSSIWYEKDSPSIQGEIDIPKHEYPQSKTIKLAFKVVSKRDNTYSFQVASDKRDIQPTAGRATERSRPQTKRVA